MEKYPVDKIYRQIEPGPVLLVCTQNNGVPNVMTIGFQMMIESDFINLQDRMTKWENFQD